MLDFLQNVVAFIVTLGVLVTIHEYGHFWVARRCHVEVKRFSVGFGKVLWRKVDKHGTEFVIAMIPLGGYVKMLDSRIDEVNDSNKGNAFDLKNVYQRIAVIAAGPMANFLLAILAFYITFLAGVQSVKPIIGEVITGSIAGQAQLPRKGEIIAINGERTDDWRAVNLALVSAIGDKNIEISVKAENSVSSMNFILDTDHWQFSPDKQSVLTSLGIQPYQPLVTTEIAQVAADSAAEKIHLQVGDKLLAINATNVENNWQLVVETIQQHPSKALTLTIERAGVEQTLTVTPDSREFNGKIIGVLGVVPKAEPYPKHYIVKKTYNIFQALPTSVQETWRLISLSFDMIGKLFTGQLSLNNLSGPMSIAQGAGTSASYGVIAYLGFLALISINLGIINLLPIPVLDGGHLLYYVIEMITGKPVPEKIQEIGFKFGTIALLSLMSIAIFNDISRL